MTLRCGFTANGDVCNQPIEADSESYSGYSHVNGTGWFHWASPTPFGPGEKETQRIFKPCKVCGKLGSENKAHLGYGGHQFEAA